MVTSESHLRVSAFLFAEGSVLWVPSSQQKSVKSAPPRLRLKVKQEKVGLPLGRGGAGGVRGGEEPADSTAVHFLFLEQFQVCLAFTYI